MSKIKLLKNIFFVSILVFFIFPQICFGIGQMTKPIIKEDILRGQEIQEVLIFSNSDDQTILVQMTVEGDIATWASFYSIEDANLKTPISEISIPPKSNIRAVVKFLVPDDVINKKYNGEIIITTAPIQIKDEKDSLVQLMQSIGREVSITVTDKEIINLKTTVIPKQYWVNQGKPLNIKVIYDNQGNVALKPQTKLLITKNEQVVFEATFPYPSEEQAVKPLERKVFDPLLIWQTAGQEQGQYRARVSILLNNEVIQEESFRFDILSFSEQALAFVAKIGFGNLGLGWFFVGLAFVLIALMVTLFSKKPQFFKGLANKIKNNHSKQINL